MMKMAMSPAAAALLRSLLGRAGVERDRILLTEFRSTDWQSLTFVGHQIRLRITGPDSREIARRLLDGLEDAELEVWGHFVADITVSEGPFDRDDGSVELGVEALTVADS